MLKLEKILGIIGLVGVMLKYLLLTMGGSFLLSTSLLILADLYLLFGIALFNKIEIKQFLKTDSFKEIPKLYIVTSIGLGISLSMLLVGSLFKINHWPNSSFLLITGTFISSVAFVVFLIQYFKSKQEFYLRLIKRIAIIGPFALILLSVSDLTLSRIQLRNNKDWMKAYEEYQKDPKNMELRKKLNLEYYKATVSKKEYELYLERMNKR